jgi:hypothetical protein
VHLENRVTQKAALEALNTLPPMPDKYAEFLEKFAEIPKSSVPFELRSHALVNWRNQANQTVKFRHDGFLRNYLATAPSMGPPSPARGESWQLQATISRKESLSFRDALASAHLRKFVDEWLNTGRKADGSELLGDGTFKKARGAYEAVWEYLNKAPSRWQPSSDPAASAWP